MKAAAVDIGTNSVRLLVAEVAPGSGGPRLRTLHRLMRITRLGEGVDRHGRLAEAPLARTKAVLEEYWDLIRGEEVDAWVVAATSAVRDARNASTFQDMVEGVTGAPALVLTGEEEARLSYLGATYDLGELRPSEGTLLVLDIGGGSTEVILGKGRELVMEKSVEVGCVRMSERFLRSDPPTRQEREEMEAHVRGLIAPIAREVAVARPSLAVGLAGTITTLAGLKLGLACYDGDAIHHTRLVLGEVEELYEKLFSLPVEERREFMRLEPGRADVIVGGCGVLVTVMRETGLRELLVSEKDILDGMVLEAAKAIG